jgi:hypothetical protein
MLLFIDCHKWHRLFSVARMHRVCSSHALNTGSIGDTRSKYTLIILRVSPLSILDQIRAIRTAAFWSPVVAQAPSPVLL